MSSYTISSFEETGNFDKINHAEICIKDTNGEKYIGNVESSFGKKISNEQLTLERINRYWGTKHNKLVGLTFQSHKNKFPSAFKAFFNGKREFYDHKITLVEAKDSFYKIASYINKNRCSSKDSVLWFYSKKEINDLLKITDRNIDNLVGYTFSSKYKHFDDAWNRYIFGIIKTEDIENKVIIPVLENIMTPDGNRYEYKHLDKYFDKIVFEDKELVKITDREYNNYYDSTKWLERIQIRIPDVKLEAVLDENKFNIKPKGSSYWYITATKDGKKHDAIMGFNHNFIQWIN